MRRKPMPWPDNLLTRLTAMPNGCIEFTGGRTDNGYGVVWVEGHTMTAHRAMWSLHVGPIPETLELDHLCQNRACVNLDHLELVTHRINTLRGRTIVAAHAAKTHCPQGHPYGGTNLVMEKGRRRCRECKNAASRRYKARMRSQ